jgi:deoxyribose-phosphate aldolase
MENPAPLIDHTLLRPDVVPAQIEALCEEAVEYGFASVCLPPIYVPRALELLYGSAVKTCSVVGFPCGYNSLQQKITETAELVSQGVEELDVVLHLGHLLAGNLNRVEEELARLVLAAQSALVKVIIECCYLSPAQMRQVTELVALSGAAFVKTSTGFGPTGAKVGDVRLLTQTAAGRIGVKAAGGIRDLADCVAMLAAGATRIGSSSGVTIVNQWRQQREC